VSLLLLFIYFFLSSTHYINRAVTTKAKALKTEHETRKIASAPLVSRLITRAHTSSDHLYVYTGYITFNECRARERVCVCINRRSENRKTLYRGDRTMAVSAAVVYIFIRIIIYAEGPNKTGNKKHNKTCNQQCTVYASYTKLIGQILCV